LEAGDRRDLALALKISRDTVEEARPFIRALNTDDFSRELPRLLAAEAEDFYEETGIRVRTATEGVAFPLPPNVGVVLFKAAREGLANVDKHVGASTVDLVLSYGSGRVSLEVRDDGVGPDGREAVALEHRGSLTAAATARRPYVDSCATRAGPSTSRRSRLGALHSRYASKSVLPRRPRRCLRRTA
jgi:hypothetical protein